MSNFHFAPFCNCAVFAIRRLCCAVYSAPFLSAPFIPRIPSCAVRHNTTNLNKNPDSGETDIDVISLRTVARASYYSTGSTEVEGKVNSPANEAILGSPESHLFSLAIPAPFGGFCKIFHNSKNGKINIVPKVTLCLLLSLLNSYAGNLCPKRRSL